MHADERMLFHHGSLMNDPDIFVSIRPRL